MSRNIFNPYDHNMSEKVKYGEEGFYNPGDGNLPEHTVDKLRTGQPTSLTQSQQSVIDSPMNMKFNASYIMYLIAGVMILGVIRSAVSGNFDLTKSVLLFGISAVCVIAGLLIKSREVSDDALANDGRQEAYIHTVTDKKYFQSNSNSGGAVRFTCLITVAGEQFSVRRQVYDSLNAGDYVTCIITSSGGRYYVDFLP